MQTENEFIAGNLLLSCWIKGPGLGQILHLRLLCVHVIVSSTNNICH